LFFSFSYMCMFIFATFLCYLTSSTHFRRHSLYTLFPYTTLFRSRPRPPTALSSERWAGAGARLPFGSGVAPEGVGGGGVPCRCPRLGRLGEELVGFEPFVQRRVGGVGGLGEVPTQHPRLQLRGVGHPHRRHDLHSLRDRSLLVLPHPH